MTWQVYALIDPRDDGIFYIGCSTNLKNRLVGHQNDPASAAWPRCQHIREAGLRPSAVVLSQHADKMSAKNEEDWLIAKTPNLVNREVPGASYTDCLGRPYAYGSLEWRKDMRRATSQSSVEVSG